MVELAHCTGKTNTVLLLINPGSGRPQQYPANPGSQAGKLDSKSDSPTTLSGCPANFIP